MLTLETVAKLSDRDLLDSLHRVVGRHRHDTADLLVHLGEVEARELHLKAACSSMFAYCTEVLGFSEGAAYNRIGVARLARRMPAVLDLVREGSLSLSALRVLVAPLGRLGSDEQRDLLRDAAGKTKRQIETLLAQRSPKPCVADRVQRLPTSSPTPPDVNAAAASDTAPTEAPRPAATTAKKPATRPLSAQRFKVTFTAGAELVDRLERVQKLLVHRGPKADIANVLERALGLLEDKLLKERFGVGRRPTERAPRRPQTVTRHVPAAVRREVVARDGLRCAYVDPETGRRCGERDVQLQHHRPFALGGEHSADNVSLFCRRHNRYTAHQDFGKRRVAARIETARKTRAASSPSRSASSANQPVDDARQATLDLG